MGFGLAFLPGWTVGVGLAFGIALLVASTAVLLRAVQEHHLLETERGRIAVGWLIVEDLAMVPVLVLLPALAGLLGASREALTSDPLAAHFGFGLPGVLLLTFIKVAVFVGLMLLVGRRVFRYFITSHTLDRVSCFALPYSRSRSAWPSVLRSCLASRWRSERSLLEC